MEFREIMLGLAVAHFTLLKEGRDSKFVLGLVKEQPYPYKDTYPIICEAADEVGFNFEIDGQYNRSVKYNFEINPDINPYLSDVTCDNKVIMVSEDNSRFQVFNAKVADTPPVVCETTEEAIRILRSL